MHTHYTHRYTPAIKKRQQQQQQKVKKFRQRTEEVEKNSDILQFVSRSNTRRQQ